MSEYLRLTSFARAYVAAVVILGLVIVCFSIDRLWHQPIGPQWLIIAGLTLLTGSFTVKVPSINASLSVSETFVFASVLLFGPSAGAATVLLECLTILFWMKPQARSLHRILFNTAAPAISIWISGYAFFSVAGIQPYSIEPTPLEHLLLPLLLFTSLYFLLNSWLVAAALGFETHTSAVNIWWNNFTWLSVNYFSGASVAALLVTYTRHLDIWSLVIIVPLLVVSYLTFRTAMGRVEDTNQHLEQLNRLYLSTVETLAMAIDAKDQVTHGHIRRVQVFAMQLARHLGVKDITLIRAIEAAALLHDMGKLAVPEYILNKPGKLTQAEFEKMKLHATVGADILSAIDFPYPVVPIVRHHHENWNGTGYPSGLKGTDIPIGARILSVVDCYDALTSDRPYRPRLTDDEAMNILRERRGSMYDPLIVDTFARMLPTLRLDPASPKSSEAAFRQIASARRTISDDTASPVLETIAASSGEMLTIYELVSSLVGHATTDDLGDVISAHVRRLIPSALCVFYIIDDRTAELEAKHAVGVGADVLLGTRIPVGQRLSGWVAAHRRTILNADAILDFGEAVRSGALKLRSGLSTPLISEDNLFVGVLTLYSAEPNAFTDDHCRIIEAIAQQIATSIHRSTQLTQNPVSSSIARLPDVLVLSELLRACGEVSDLQNITLAMIDVRGMRQVIERFGQATGDEVLQYVGRKVRSVLPVGDILFRSVNDEFVVLLRTTDPESVRALRSSILEAIHGDSVDVGKVKLSVDVEINILTSSQDHRTLQDLLNAARLRFDYGVRTAKSSIH
jgi:diguanylate cyclase (GGDEF)-like protein/putative nucleotidyltransferase with HDIG domain